MEARIAPGLFVWFSRPTRPKHDDPMLENGTVLHLDRKERSTYFCAIEI
jgi:hypothetical protein